MKKLFALLGVCFFSSLSVFPGEHVGTFYNGFQFSINRITYPTNYDRITNDLLCIYCQEINPLGFSLGFSQRIMINALSSENIRSDLEWGIGYNQISGSLIKRPEYPSLLQEQSVENEAQANSYFYRYSLNEKSILLRTNYLLSNPGLNYSIFIGGELNFNLANNYQSVVELPDNSTSRLDRMKFDICSDEAVIKYSDDFKKAVIYNSSVPYIEKIRISFVLGISYNFYLDKLLISPSFYMMTNSNIYSYNLGLGLFL